MAVIVLVWKDADDELDAGVIGEIAVDVDDPGACGAALQLPTVLESVEKIRNAGGYDVATFVRPTVESL